MLLCKELVCVSAGLRRTVVLSSTILGHFVLYYIFSFM